ncbi:MAG: UDP-N-acetylmuramoyl-L-alanyl-D-glutamate--2,6-diaminopimelate ligase, partial [Thermacetogenium phaeum]
MAIPFHYLLHGVDIVAARGLHVPVAGVHYDSRQVRPGYIFVCIVGYRTDGHLYIQDAIARGAAGFVIEKDVPLPPGVPYARVRSSRRALAVIGANYYGQPSRS